MNLQSIKKEFRKTIKMIDGRFVSPGLREVKIIKVKH